MKTLLAVDGSDNSYEAVHALKYFARAEPITSKVWQSVRAIGHQARGVAVIGTPSTMILQEATTLRSESDLDGHKGPARNHTLRARQRVSCGAT